MMEVLGEEEEKMWVNKVEHAKKITIN